MGTSGRSHRVGVTASLVGLAAYALPFATVSRSRIATGEASSLFAVAGVGGAVLVLAPWVLALAFSLAPGARERRWYACGRGLAASGAVVVSLCVSGRAAGPLLEVVGEFARYSLGPAVWLSAFAAFVLAVAARREVHPTSLAGWAVTLAAPTGVTAFAAFGALDRLGIAVEFRNLSGRFWPAVGQHVAYSAAAILVATVLGVSLGVLAFKSARFERPVFVLVNALQTIPGLALVGMLVAPLAVLSQAIPSLRDFGIGGLGWAPLLIALTLYALLAVVRNTYAGLASVSAETVEAGIGMGMTSWQVLARVQFPLARPIVFSGVRIAAQQTVGNATLGAFVAAGGLGPLIFLGLAQQANDLVLLGSVALVTLALVADGAMRGVQRLITPRMSREGTS